MNAYESDLSVLLTAAEASAEAELLEEIAELGIPLSHLMFSITVEYPAIEHTTTYQIRSLYTAAKMVARSREGNCPVSVRLTIRPEHREAYRTPERIYKTLSDYILNARW